jgi:hypothetical protein
LPLFKVGALFAASSRVAVYNFAAVCIFSHIRPCCVVLFLLPAPVNISAWISIGRLNLISVSAELLHQSMADAAYVHGLLSPQGYYARLDGDRDSAWPLKDKFHDIDDPTHFKPYMKRLSDPLTKNFVLDFGNEDAFCATDLGKDEFKLLLSKPVR